VVPATISGVDEAFFVEPAADAYDVADEAEELFGAGMGVCWLAVDVICDS
jgi:hypothetical protein